MLATLDAEEIHDRLKETWATQGVVSGLISGIAVEGLLSPPSFAEDGDIKSLDSKGGILTCLWFGATIFGLFSVMSSVVSFFISTFLSQPV